MTKPHDLEEDDRIRIDSEDVSDTLFRVSSKEVEGIGITETFAVGLVSDSERYSIVGTTSDRTATLCEFDGDGEDNIWWDDIEIQ